MCTVHLLVVIYTLPVPHFPCDAVSYQVDRLSRELKRVRREEARWRLLAEERQAAIEQLSLVCEQSEQVCAFIARPMRFELDGISMTAEDESVTAGV